MSQVKQRKIDVECRIFNDNWTFKYLIANIEDKAMCLVCNEYISVFNEYNIKRDFTTKYLAKYNQFSPEQMKIEAEKLINSLHKQQNIFKTLANTDIALTKASYIVAHKVAKQCKPFSDGEFVKECLVDIAELLCPDKQPTFEKICMSRRTLVRRIDNISSNLCDQLKSKLDNCTYLALALDESRDITDTSQFLIFIRGINKRFEITEELLSVYPMKDTTTGENLFIALQEVLQKHSIKWDKIVNITTDGCPSLIGKNIGLLKRLKDKMKRLPGKEVIFLHCIIHQEILCKRVLKLKHVISVVTNVVNFIRGRALNHRQFSRFLKEIECDFTDIPYHTDIRWLSLAKVLKRFHDLLDEIINFLDVKDKLNEFCELKNEQWLNDFFFSVDILSFQNELNLLLQGKGLFVYDMYTNVTSFTRKLKLFSQQLQNKQLTHFPILQKRVKYLKCADFKKYEAMFSDLHNEFTRRFEDFQIIYSDLQLVSLPFTFNVNDAQPCIQLELIDLQSSSILKNKFYEKTIT